jgi:hypothetical protein
MIPVMGRQTRGIIVATTLALVALVGASGARMAHAAVVCRVDPVVAFSNGVTVDLYAQIGDALSDVRHVSYVLHGPALAASTSYAVSYPDGTAGISSFSYVGDGQPHSYYADITVTTGATPVSVTAYLDWVAGGKHNTGTAQVSGQAGHPVETPVLRVVCANLCTG